jgi:hypothetical protein
VLYEGTRLRPAADNLACRRSEEQLGHARRSASASRKS